jgi:hypothetical protein
VKVLKAISTLLLAMLVLLTSMGFYVDHMVCGMSGEHKVAINASIEPCSDSCDRSEEEALDRSCCDYNSNYFQEDLPVNPSQESKKQQYSSFKHGPVSEIVQPAQCVETFWVHLIDEPDILPSVERHILLETYLI